LDLEFIQGSPPLRGSFSIIGTTLDGSQFQTDDILYNSSPNVILGKIIKACPEYRDIDIWEGTTPIYYDNGREIYNIFVSSLSYLIYIRFKSFN
jgi:hypothetical protein